MGSPTTDDFLQFGDFNENPTNSAPAQINVNSPIHSNNINSNTNQRQRGGGGGGNDPLIELIYDITNIADVDGGSMFGGSAGATAGSGVNNFGLDGTANYNPNNKVSFLQIEYYQQFFNVDTFMVLERIANSMIPKRAPGNYLRMIIGENPDLYGPFWITITLIFSIAISGNIASYLAHASDAYQWHYNFHLVSYAATCIFLYVNLVPIVLWALFKYSLKPYEDVLETDSAKYTPSLLSIMCIYGYSLAIYIPVSMLWVIPIYLLQWLLVVTAALLSGLVLITVLAPALRNSKYSFFLIIGILAAHFLLAAGFMLYFFHAPSPSAPIINSANLSQRSVHENIVSGGNGIGAAAAVKQVVGDIAGAINSSSNH